MRCWWLLAGFLATAHAEEPAGPCHPVAKIQAQVKGCPANALFVRAAELCNQKLDQELQAAQATLALVDVSAAGGQSQGLAAQAAKLSELKATVALLASEASAAKNQMARYSDAFQLPGGVSRAEADSLKLGSFFLSFPCYSNNAAGLLDNTAAAQKRVEDLQSLAQKTDELLARSQAGAKGMGSGVVLEATPAPALAPIPPPARAPASAPSDVTGTEQKTDFIP